MSDPGCANPADASEQNSAVACDDGTDNDGDALIDFADPGCGNVSDPSEQNSAVACDDGIDNDGDLLIDWPADPECSNAIDTSEGSTAPQVPMLGPIGLLALAGALVATAGAAATRERRRAPTMRE